MSTVVPCIKGQMGNTPYYEAMVPARELVASVRPASDLDEWAQMAIEERMQRDPNLKRIKDDIAPYLAKAADRFFGAIIVLVYKGTLTFEGVKEFGGKIPSAYKKVSERLGFLTIDGGTLIVLDGQHRLLALKSVIHHEVTGPEAPQVPLDDVCVIFINHENAQKTRRIFNRVNRYAKPTSRGDNIITSEDDAYAIVTRWLLNKENALGATSGGDSIVNWKSNTLAPRSTQFITISAMYEITKIVLAAHKVSQIDSKIRPDEETLEGYLGIVNSFWSEILSSIPAYTQALADPSKIPGFRSDTSPMALLFKPAAQIAICGALALAIERGADANTLYEKLSKLNWSMKDDMWRDVIIRSSGNIDVSTHAREITLRLITYLIAPEAFNEDEVKTLQEDINTARGSAKSKPLPAPVALTQAKKAKSKKST